MDKCTATIRLHLPDAMRLDLHDLAATSERDVSEFIRLVLEDYLYGAQRHICRDGRQVPERVGPGLKGRP